MEIIKKLVLGLEVVAGLGLLLSVIFNSRETAFENSLGTELTLTHGVFVLAIYYIVRGLFKLLIELNDPTEGF